MGHFTQIRKYFYYDGISPSSSRKGGGAEALDKSCNENENTHFMQNIFYRKSHHLRDAYVKYDSVGRILHHRTQCGS